MVTNFYVLKTNKKNIAHLMYDRKIIKCKVGKNGIGIKTREGDRVTPRGTYKFFEVFYRSDRVNDIKPKIPTKKIERKSVWCVDSKSPFYNTFQKRKKNFCCENLYRKDHLYDIFITTSFNINPVKKFKGSAIFLHCLDKNDFTEGCLAIEKNHLFEILKLIKPSSKLIIY